MNEPHECITDASICEALSGSLCQEGSQGTSWHRHENLDTRATCHLTREGRVERGGGGGGDGEGRKDEPRKEERRKKKRRVGGGRALMSRIPRGKGPKVERDGCAARYVETRTTTYTLLTRMSHDVVERLQYGRLYVGAASPPLGNMVTPRYGLDGIYRRDHVVLMPVVSSRGSFRSVGAAIVLVSLPSPARVRRESHANTRREFEQRCSFSLDKLSAVTGGEGDGRNQPVKMAKIRNTIECAVVLLALSAVVSASSSVNDDGSFLERGYRALYRVYEECQHRNVAVSPCLKKKAIAFFERLGRIETLPIAENLELVKAPTSEFEAKSANVDLETTLGRTSGASREEILNEILFDRVANLLNSFNVQIRLPKTSSGELKRSIEEGRGKMKKMMGMMMMGMAMKMAALVPIAMGVLFLLAGKALIISKIALVLSLIIGLKKLLSQKQSHDHGGWQQGGGGWDRSLKGVIGPTITDADREYAQSLAYSAHKQR